MDKKDTLQKFTDATDTRARVGSLKKRGNMMNDQPLYPFATIRVFNELGYDTETRICWTRADYLDQVRQLRKQGYLSYQSRNAPCRPFFEIY